MQFNLRSQALGVTLQQLNVFPLALLIYMTASGELRIDVREWTQ